jgi:hypothetical protein
VRLPARALPGRRNVPLVAVGALLVLFVLLFPVTRQEDPDVWFHLSVGRHLWTTGEFPSMDHFLYTVPDDRLFTSHKWLFQSTIYPVYLLFRMEGLVAVKSLLIGISFLSLFFGAVTRRSFIPALAFFLTAFAAGSGRFTIHPEIAGGLIFALMWRILSRPLTLSGAMYMAGLQVLWTNLHWSSVLGPAMAASFAVAGTVESLLHSRRHHRPQAKERKPSAFLLLFILLVAATFINPDGHRPLAESLRQVTAGEFRPALAEIRDSCRLSLEGGGASTRPWHFLALGLGWTSFLACRRRIDFTHLFIFTVFGLLSLVSERLLLFFSLLAIPTVAANIETLTKNLPLPEGRRARAASALAAAAVIVTLIVNKVTGIPYLIPYPKPCEPLSVADSGFLWPHRAAAFIVDNGLPGRIFNNSSSGSYLNWAIPSRRTFINDDYADPGTREEYARLEKNPERWDSFSDEWGIETVFLRLWPRVSPPRLTASLLRHRRWKLVYYDGSAAVLVRAGPEDPRPPEEHAVDLDRELQGAVRAILSGINSVPGINIPIWGEVATYRWRQDLARTFHLRGDFYRLAGRRDLAGTAEVMARNLEGR